MKMANNGPRSVSQKAKWIWNLGIKANKVTCPHK